jgi:hypothetical protein
MTPALQDLRGCLTEAGFEVLARSAPGRAPAEIVTHLARCARCQDRTLARSAGLAPDAPRVKKQPPPLWRTVLVLVAALALLASVLMMLYRVRQ